MVLCNNKKCVHSVPIGYYDVRKCELKNIVLNFREVLPEEELADDTEEFLYCEMFRTKKGE